MYQAAGQQAMWQNPWLQYMLGGGQAGGNRPGYNPFFNVYSPAPPGTSATTQWPTPMAPPGVPPPPIQPPPSSATVSPIAMTGGVPPIGQMPPAPYGTVAGGQGGAAVPGAGDVMGGAVPPFQAYTAPPPNPLVQPPQAPAAVGGGGQAPSPGAFTNTGTTGGGGSAEGAVPNGAPPGTFSIGGGWFGNPAWSSPMTLQQLNQAIAAGGGWQPGTVTGGPGSPQTAVSGMTGSERTQSGQTQTGGISPESGMTGSERTAGQVDTGAFGGGYRGAERDPGAFSNGNLP